MAKLVVLVQLFMLFSKVEGTSFSSYMKKNEEPLFINGPRSLSDRIAIVGAGASGIHMATMLKNKGFTNIVIYEKNNRIGGKSMTIRDTEGTVQELGSCCIGPGYENNIMKIIEEYAPGELVPRQFGDVWLDGAANATSYGHYVVKETMKHFNTNSVKEALLKLFQKIDEYVSLHKSLFPMYEFELMPRPKPEVMRNLRCTFLQFLERHNLRGLLPLLLVSHTLQGYGYLDEISAVYGLIWNTPFLMQSFKEIMSGDTTPRTFMLRSGFQHLWEKVAKVNALNIRLNSNIQTIKRSRYGVQVCDAEACYSHDFLIWSGEATRSLRVLDKPTKLEINLFFKLSPDYLVSSLVRLKGGKESSTATGYWFDNIIKKRSVSVLASRNTKRVFELGGVYPLQQSSVTGRRFELAYQYSPTRPCKPHEKALLHFYETGATEAKIARQVVWRYFPHFSVEEAAAGSLWDILEMQGKSRTWFIGSSVSFESLKSVVEYNKLLISIMRPLEE